VRNSCAADQPVGDISRLSTLRVEMESAVTAQMSRSSLFLDSLAQHDPLCRSQWLSTAKLFGKEPGRGLRRALSSFVDH
jgi:hypothetical protein